MATKHILLLPQSAGCVSRLVSHRCCIISTYQQEARPTTCMFALHGALLEQQLPVQSFLLVRKPWAPSSPHEVPLPRLKCPNLLKLRGQHRVKA